MLPVQGECAVVAGHRTHTGDVAVVELDELEWLARPTGGVVVRLEERLGAGEALPDTRSDERAELALGTGTHPDDAIPLVEHDEWRFLLHRDGHGADIVRPVPEGVDPSAAGTLRQCPAR